MSKSTFWWYDEVKRSWKPRSKNSGWWSASSWFNESDRGVDEKQGCSPSEFLEKPDERLSGFSMNDWPSPLLDDGLTYGVSYEWSIMGASIDGDTHERIGMVASLKMLGKNGGGTNRDGRSSTTGGCSSSLSYSAWILAYVGCATSNPSIDRSSFKISVEFEMEEHKIVPSGGWSKYEDKGLGTKYMWRGMGIL